MHINSFQKAVDLMHRALDVNALRYTVSANNLASSEIPNFKRTSVNFETELKHALDIDYRSVSPRRVLDYATTAKANGNNVDAEEEAMNILKIQMQYQLLSQMTGFQYSQVQSVLK